jgi:hypothetical protein
MATTLSTYITQVRRLLHDVNANFWTDPELTDYINEGRNRLVRDTGCLRKIQSSTLVANQEIYNLSDLPSGNLNMDILNINVYWGNSRLPLRYLPWTQFNTQMRFWQNYIGQPIAYSMYGPGQFYVGPVPDQNYTVEIDTVIQPVTLVNSTDVDEIPNPWTGPVQFYAAYLAKFKEQSYGEAELFKNQYISQAQSVLSTTYTRRIPDPYSSAY